MSASARAPNTAPQSRRRRGGAKAEVPPDRAKEIAELEEAVRVKRTILKALDAARLELKIALAGKSGPAFDDYTRLRQQAARTEDELKALNDKLARLTAAPPKPEAVAAADDLRILDTQLEMLRFQAKLIEEEILQTRRRAEELVAKAKELNDQGMRVQEARNRLHALNANQAGGYLVLTVSGKVGEPLYAIREMPAGGKALLGPVFVTHPDMLAKLLTRAKADATGPQLARVVAEPQMALGLGPASALKACDAAGYKTVTFTGYVPLRRSATELQASAKGNVPDYVWHDAKEKKAAELLKEIEDGLKKE